MNLDVWKFGFVCVHEAFTHVNIEFFDFGRYRANPHFLLWDGETGRENEFNFNYEPCGCEYCTGRA